MQTIKISDLNVDRAGSDFLGFAWSMHATGFDFQKGEHYLLQRPDGSTFEVVAEKRNRTMGWHLVDMDGALMLGIL